MLSPASVCRMGLWSRRDRTNGPIQESRPAPTVLLDGAPFTDGRTIEEMGDNLVTELR